MNISALKSCPGVTDAMVDQVLALLIDFKPGRYEFEGDAYANAEEYTTVGTTEKDFEAHRKFIDVQIIVEGQEIIEVVPVDSPEFEVTVPYVHDIVFMNGPVKQVRKEELHAGEFCVLYPQDAHKPCTHLDGPHKVKKIVIKLPVE